MAKANDSQMMVEKYMSKVVAIAESVYGNLPTRFDREDLIQEGALGLVDAAAKYDSTKNASFGAYATYRVRGAILDSLRRGDWVSRTLRRQSKLAAAKEQDLATRLGRSPTGSEMAHALDVSLRTWQRMSAQLYAAGLGENSAGHGAEVDQQPSTYDSPERACAKAELASALLCAMQGLRPRYRRVVVLLYSHGWTMKQIGRDLGVNESRTSQIHKAAIRIMRASMRDRGFTSTAPFQEALG